LDGLCTACLSSRASLASGTSTLLGTGRSGDLLNAVGAWVNEFEFEAAAQSAIECVDEFARLAVGTGDADLLDANGSAVGIEKEVGAGGFEADPASGFTEDGLAGNNPRACGLGRLYEPERREECDEGGGCRGAIKGMARNHDKGGGNRVCRVSDLGSSQRMRGAVRAP